MLLVIDIGNTNVVLGVFEKEDLLRAWRISTRKDRTAEEYAVLCTNLFQLGGLSTSSVQDVAVCSVVPPLNDCFEQMARRYFGADPLFVEPDRQNVIPIHYKSPSDVGADRIVNSLAAYRLYGGPAILLDFGTATTFDVISRQGEYLGGIIAPGIGISAEALFVRAARLPRIEIRKPPSIIGHSTVTSMQSGIYFGYVSLVEGILQRMKHELGDTQVIATGGLAPLICGEAQGIDRLEENLTLYGLRFFHEKLRGRTKPKRAG